MHRVGMRNVRVEILLSDFFVYAENLTRASSKSTQIGQVAEETRYAAEEKAKKERVDSSENRLLRNRICEKAAA